MWKKFDPYVIASTGLLDCVIDEITPRSLFNAVTSSADKSCLSEEQVNAVKSVLDFVVNDLLDRYGSTSDRIRSEYEDGYGRTIKLSTLLKKEVTKRLKSLTDNHWVKKHATVVEKTIMDGASSLYFPRHRIRIDIISAYDYDWTNLDTTDVETGDAESCFRIGGCHQEDGLRFKHCGSAYVLLFSTDTLYGSRYVGRALMLVDGPTIAIGNYYADTLHVSILRDFVKSLFDNDGWNKPVKYYPSIFDNRDWQSFTPSGYVDRGITFEIPRIEVQEDYDWWYNLRTLHDDGDYDEEHRHDRRGMYEKVTHFAVNHPLAILSTANVVGPGGETPIDHEVVFSREDGAVTVELTCGATVTIPTNEITLNYMTSDRGQYVDRFIPTVLIDRRSSTPGARAFVSGCDEHNIFQVFEYMWANGLPHIFVDNVSGDVKRIAPHYQTVTVDIFPHKKTNLWIDGQKIPLESFLTTTETPGARRLLWSLCWAGTSGYLYDGLLRFVETVGGFLFTRPNGFDISQIETQAKYVFDVVSNNARLGALSNIQLTPIPEDC